MVGTKTLQALVVDDNYFNRDLCKLALSHVGFDYVEATNGREALNALPNHKIDLILLDLSMPEMDGVGFVKEIRMMEAYKDTQIIVLTANPHMATPEVEDAAEYILQKPIDIQMLSSLLERIKRTHTGL